jgi:DNA polymerase-3 subunit gamma/tau
MRGATPPRLILELICGQIMLPAAGGAATQSAPVKEVPKDKQSTLDVKVESSPVAKTERIEKSVKVEAKKEVNQKPVEASGSIDITSLRRMWPQVIENVKGKRRLTWSLLATSAQIIFLDDESISIGIVNTGARDSFVRSESDVILSDAFFEVTGVRRKIVATVDSSVAVTTMARADEDPADKNMLSGAELLASKLGAKVIKESN